jgi:hypothetical protein
LQDPRKDRNDRLGHIINKNCWGIIMIYKNYELSFEEELALINIDLMKTEITSIHKSTISENTSVTYALSKEKENKMHDDRFYTIIMLAHRLYELRRGQTVNLNSSEYDFDFSDTY